MNSQTPSFERIPPSEGPEQASPSTPPDIPDHQLLTRIGRGSYGDVWLGRNKLGTLRAIKIVHRAAFDDARPFEREFKGIQKFEPISRSHEGLVDILQVGGTEEYCYYVMELADAAEQPRVERESELRVERGAPADSLAHPMGEGRGQDNTQSAIANPQSYVPRTLRSDLRRLGRLPVAECVSIGLSLSSALAHLHKHRLVHRDVKPSNIIFVGGAPKLADIGLVADLGEARSFVGTQGFIPPEGPGTPQADLYSLGKVLYELSTGKDRHDFPQLPPDVLRAGQDRGSRREEAHSDSDNKDQSLLTSAATNSDEATSLIELNEVLLKACHKDLRQRYPSADAMLAELELLQRGQSVQRKRAKEHRLTFAKRIGIVFVVLALFSAGSWLVLPRAFHHPSVQNKGTPNLDAYNHYQMGRFYWNKRTGEGLQKAIEHFQRAIDLDPMFARAYAGLADCYNLLAENGIGLPKDSKPKSRDAAHKALSLDDKLAEAHASLAMFKKEFEWDWLGAEREFNKAIALDPNYATARHWYSQYLLCVGRLTDAVSQAESALRLEPTSLIINANLAFCLMHARRYDEAVAQFERTRDMDPHFAKGRVNLGSAYEVVKRYEDAVAEWEKGLTLAGENAELIAALREAYRASGMTGYWQKKLEQLEKKPNDKPVAPNEFAAIHARLGNDNQAFAWLDKACAERYPLMTYIYTDPVFDRLRSDPRFVALRRKMGLEK